MGGRAAIFLNALTVALALSVWVCPALGDPAQCPGNEGADDTQCLQRYLDTTADSALMRMKSYLVSRPLVLRSGRHLAGDGATIVMEGNTTAAFRLVGKDISIDNVTVDNRATVSGTVAIDVAENSEHLRVSQSHFLGTNSVAALSINAPGVTDVEFVGNEVSQGSYGVLTNWRAAHLHNVEIAHNRMYGLSGDGVEINYPVLVPPHGTGDGSAAPSDIRIEENAISAPLSQRISGGFCVGIAGGRNVTIRNNTLSHCKWQAIHIEDTASDILIEGNTISNVIGRLPSDNAGWTKFRDGIWAMNARRVTVKNNTFSDIPDAGIDFTYDAKTFDAGNIVCGNTLKRVGGYGISVMAPGGQDIQTHIGATASCGPNRIEGGTKLLHINTPLGLSVADPE